MADQIKRSNTGKYHLGSTGATNVNCNQRMYATPTSVASALRAPEHMICEKCFYGRGHAQIEHMISIGHLDLAKA
tara:strand:+ start:746 stop:970 length:225 start_codon:yes stop_codon:yes gene_type:complete